MYNLGRWIRGKYGAMIGNKYNNTRMLVRSTYAERCVMSGQTLLAGLFPPSPENMFVPGLEWIPVPVFPIPREMDKV